ncbi:hypothetical protein [Cypionkella sp.]|uniref:hypothetical protein n=1 Tax=Cypionkella sp. TaxID=2811411 RepID=UPI002ABAAC57|nr:hypothetical protein [Cypionkella sp.]MDZ4391545.1 hypothetical protein [Cypionkella sp.]
MGTFYAAVEVFDPEGPVNMPDGAEYGGEARFFVLTAEDLSEALATLANSISVNGLRLDRVLHAGAVEAFDDEILPFEIDIDGMAETAQGSGEICVSEPHPFEPDESDGVASGCYAVCIDAFDMEWADEDEGEYGGHYQLAVIKAETAAEALQQLVEDFEAEGIMIISLEGLVDAKAFPFDAYEFQFEEDDAVSEVLEQGGMIVSNAYAYPPEAPRKLDS